MGFEPTFAFAKTVFKTVTIGLSVTPPQGGSIIAFDDAIVTCSVAAVAGEGASRIP